MYNNALCSVLCGGMAAHNVKSEYMVAWWVRMRNKATWCGIHYSWAI